jgi:hypothetical protein
MCVDLELGNRILFESSSHCSEDASTVSNVYIAITVASLHGMILALLMNGLEIARQYGDEIEQKRSRIGVDCFFFLKKKLARAVE